MKRMLTALLLAAVSSSPAAAAITYPGLTINTGPGGQAVSLNATITTLIIQPPGTNPVIGPPQLVALNLPDFTGLSAEMNWFSPCESTPGCVIAAPSEIDVMGFSGLLQFYGGEMLLNGAPLPWLGGPPQTMFVSGPLAFTVSTYTDNSDFITLSVVPEPAAMALFGVGLLGLGFAMRRRGG